MKRKLLFTFLLFTTVGLNNSLFAQATPTAASALWQPASGANIPGNVAVTGNIQANEQAGTLEAYTYSTSATAVSNATGFQRLRSSSTAPALPFGNVYDSNFYVEYKVQAASGKFLRVTELKLTALGGGTGNARLVVKYSTNGTTFIDMPVVGNYFLADGTAANYGGTEAQPVILINSGATALPEAQRTLTYTGMAVNLDPGQFFTVRLYPYLTDLTAPSSRYLFTRNLVISGLSQDTTLPLDFLSFSAKPDALNKFVNLNWSTTNEVNTKNFEIQKRTDASDFKTIGVVKSKNISGVHQYAFADDNLTSGTSYYRLNQVDNDGKSSFSDIVTVNVKSAVSLSVYPNPVENFLSLTHPVTSNKAFAKIINLEGKTILQQTLNANVTTSQIDVSQIATGSYLIVLEDESEKSTLKFIKK